MARQWSFHLSLLLAGALAVACAAGDELDTDNGPIGVNPLGGTAPAPTGTAGGTGATTTPPAGGTIVPPAPVGTTPPAGTPSGTGITPRPGSTTGGVAGAAAAGGGLSGTAAGGTASGTAGGGTITVDAGLTPPSPDAGVGTGTRPDAGSAMAGGGGGTAGTVTGGKCCPDGNCLCSTEPPQRLSAAKGKFGTARINVSSGTLYYPTTGSTAPYGGVAIIPGFTNIGPEMEEWGPFYASWGIVCVITSSGPLDTPDIRAVWLANAVKDMKAENTKSGSPLNGKMAGRYGTSGYSMGGGGTTVASQSDKTLKTSIGLAPWSPVGSGIVTPTLHFCGSIDVVADCSHAQWSYDSIPSTTPKMLMTVSGCDHLTCWFGPNDTGGHSGGWGLAFQKVYLEGDTRWKALLLSKPTGATVQTNIKM